MARMVKRPLFQPHEYQELTDDERALLATAYEQALVGLRKCITPMGFSSCSLKDNVVYGTDVNYRSVWARDGALTLLSTLDLEEPDIRQCQRDTLLTLLRHQSPIGQIPAHVLLDQDRAEFSGVGGIAAIDSVLWLIIACVRFAEVTDDWSIVVEHRKGLQKAMDWLEAHDSNGCGLLSTRARWTTWATPRRPPATRRWPETSGGSF
jgi:glycogen debranching enzyme